MSRRCQYGLKRGFESPKGLVKITRSSFVPRDDSEGDLTRAMEFIEQKLKTEFGRDRLYSHETFGNVCVNIVEYSPASKVVRLQEIDAVKSFVDEVCVQIGIAKRDAESGVLDRQWTQFMGESDYMEISEWGLIFKSPHAKRFVLDWVKKVALDPLTFVESDNPIISDFAKGLVGRDFA